ncbi:hypothetical protein H4582DRAFT_1598610 [Lactarius indigo]|nr:hypothetical protein H4582DRAFT_1598610 [Lactarius indigo]
MPRCRIRLILVPCPRLFLSLANDFFIAVALATMWLNCWRDPVPIALAVCPSCRHISASSSLSAPFVHPPHTLPYIRHHTATLFLVHGRGPIPWALASPRYNPPSQVQLRRPEKDFSVLVSPAPLAISSGATRDTPSRNHHFNSFSLTHTRTTHPAHSPT